MDWISIVLPIIKELWGMASKEIAILKQKGELTPELEAEFEKTKTELFASSEAQVETDPTV